MTQRGDAMSEMRNKVVQHYRGMSPEFLPTRMAELAPGVVAVEDKAGECDALFDIELWQFKDPELWRPSLISGHFSLHAAGLDVLEGLGKIPQVSSIENMVHFAQSQLSPKGSLDWYDAPLFFSF